MDNITFPENFIFGTATSAFQIEGAGFTEWNNFVGKDGTTVSYTHLDVYKRQSQTLQLKIVRLLDLRAENMRKFILFFF